MSPTSVSDAAVLLSQQHFAIALCCGQVLIAVAGATLSYAWNSYIYSSIFSQLAWYLVFMIWALTLPSGCSPWPLIFSIVFIIPSMFTGRITAPHALMNGGAVTSLAYTIFGWSTIAAPLYLAATAARDALRKEYGSSLAAASRRIGAEFGASLPVVLYFMFAGLGGYLEWDESNLLYMQHTPWCEYSPDALFQGNIPYSGCNPAKDQEDGIALLPVFLNTTTFLNRSEAVRLAADSTDGENLLALLDPVNALVANSSRLLSVHDYARIAATLDNERSGQPQGFRSLLQSFFFVFTLFHIQVMTRVSHITYSDLVAFRVTGWEMVATVVAAYLVFTALLCGSFSAEQYQRWGYTMLIVSNGLGPLILLVALWRASRAVARDAHPHLATRQRRTSVVAAEEKYLHGTSTSSETAAKAPASQPTDSGAVEGLIHSALREVEEKLRSEMSAADRAHKEVAAELRRNNATLQSQCTALLKRMATLEGGSRG